MASDRDNEESSSEFDPGTRVAAYRLEAFVAAGGMAEVYRARHVKLDKVVAIKFLDRQHAKRPEVVARFMREGRFASQIRHPNVVEVTDVDEYDGIPYLVMEYLEGQTLGERISKGGPLSPEEIAKIMLPVCAAVAAAHAKGVMHRDLKPGNIFLAETNVGEMQPKVLDFGISKSLTEDPGSSLTTSASFLGTPIYLSPEQAEGEDATVASDQYSLGVILYELATGKRPYDTGQKFIRLLNTISSGEFDPPSAHLEDISPELETLIMRTMSVAPTDRFPSVLQLANALCRIADERTRSLWAPRLEALGDDQPAAVVALPHAESDAVTALATATTVTRLTTRPPPAKKATPWRGRALVGAGALALAALAWQAVSGNGDEPAPPAAPAAASFRVVVDVVPAEAELVLDGVPRGTGRLDLTLPQNGDAHDLEVVAEGYVTERFSFRDAPPPAKVTLEALPTAPAPEPPATASATASASASAASPTPAPNPTPRPTPTATYSAHPDNIDPWKE